MSDTRKYVCNYCGSPCTLIMEGMGANDEDEDFMPVCCPYDGTMTKERRWHWQEVKE